MRKNELKKELNEKSIKHEATNIGLRGEGENRM